MNYLFRFSFLIYMILKLTLASVCESQHIILLLLLLASNIYRQRFYDSKILVCMELVLIFIGIYFDSIFIVLLGLSAFDILLHELYIFFLPIFILSFVKVVFYPEVILIVAICSAFSYWIKELFKKEEEYKKNYDRERKYRYELEDARTMLLNSSMEIAHLTEIKERNRIARDIHDNIGHSIASILMQLQAGFKLKDKNSQKSDEIIKNCILRLSDTLTLLRDTVHNIRPKEKLGAEYIKSIVESFVYCPVNFSYSGDFSRLNPNIMEIICTNIKEALTNTAKHSKATEVIIKIDICDKIVRLYIKDNGQGCNNIKDSLGLSGMKERIANLSGSISISGDDGFLIVCVIAI